MLDRELASLDLGEYPGSQHRFLATINNQAAQHGAGSGIA
jgi:hypothetical protein